MDAKDTLSLLSVVSSVASIILGIGAIWLSVVFFKMSSEASKATGEAAKEISANVKRLDSLFEKLYSDTFAMMKDTVDDMRSHIWKRQDTPSTAEISDALKKEVEIKVKEALQSEGIGNKEKQERVTKAVESVVESIVKTSKDRQISEEAEKVLKVVKKHHKITVRDLASSLGMKEDHLVVHHLFDMREAGKITWPGSKNSLSYSTTISPT